jgi:hypothetical protein
MSGKWKFQLVLQFPGSSITDFDRLIEIENMVGNGLGKGAFLDGHDFGSGAGNIFIYMNDPGPIFEKAMQLLDDRARAELRAAYREIKGEKYTILWPPTLKEFELI